MEDICYNCLGDSDEACNGCGIEICVACCEDSGVAKVYPRGNHYKNGWVLCGDIIYCPDCK